MQHYAQRGELAYTRTIQEKIYTFQQGHEDINQLSDKEHDTPYNHAFDAAMFATLG